MTHIAIFDHAGCNVSPEPAGVQPVPALLPAGTRLRINFGASPADVKGGA